MTSCWITATHVDCPPIRKSQRLSEKSPANLSFDLGPSDVLTVVVVALHLGALVVASLLPLAVPVRSLLFVTIAASGYRAVRVHAMRRAWNAVVWFQVSEDGTCSWRRRGADVPEEGPLVESTTLPWLALLTVRPVGRRSRPSTHIVVAADALPAEAFRRLRVRLRLQGVAGPE